MNIKNKHINYFLSCLDESIDRQPKLKALSDFELIEQVSDKVWASLDCFSEEADLIEELIERYKHAK